jgi:hypothetical protein
MLRAAPAEVLQGALCDALSLFSNCVCSWSCVDFTDAAALTTGVLLKQANRQECRGVHASQPLRLAKACGRLGRHRHCLPCAASTPASFRLQYMAFSGDDAAQAATLLVVC